MNRLNDTQLERREDLIYKLEKAADTLNGIIQEINDKIEVELRDALAAYNYLVQEAEGFTGEIFAEMQKHYEERSEGWKQSEQGEAYVEWFSEWEHYDSSHVDLPATLDPFDLGHAAELNNLPSEP